MVHFVLDKASRQYAMKFFSSGAAFRAGAQLPSADTVCQGTLRCHYFLHVLMIVFAELCKFLDGMAMHSCMHCAIPYKDT